MENLNQWKKVLDNIASTAIFVVEQESHEVLYYNKCMEQIHPGFANGKVCSEVWNGSCINCPLKSIGDRDSNTVVNYLTPFGRAMDTSATRIMWGEIPAYLISLSIHVPTEREQELELGRTQMYIAVSQIYSMVISINLTKNTYVMVEYADFENQNAPDSGVFDELIVSDSQSMHPDFRDAFVKNFSRESLLKLYEDGGTSRYMEHRQMGKDGCYHWTDTHVLRIDNPYNDDVLQVSLSRNIDKQKQLEAQMLEAVSKEKEASKRFAASIRDLYDGIYEADLNGGQVHSFQYSENGLISILLGQSYDETVDKIEKMQVSEESRSRYHEGMSADFLKKRLKKESGQVYFEYQRKGKDGGCRWYSNQVHLLLGSQDVFRILILIRDIDDKRREDERKKQKLEEALREARKANHAKSDFISRMSHDIRTPINAILGMSDIASSNLNNPQKLEDCLEKIGISTRYLLSMISDILDMSCIESGKLMIVEKRFNLHTLVQGIVIMITPQIAEKHQHFELYLDDEALGNYLGDELRINQVLMNLLNNAIKYTDQEGEISLEIRQKMRKGNQALIQMIVKDTGVGISEEFQKVMFQPFEQESAAAERQFEGSGLGLPLTKNLVERMGGKISFSSKLGEGSCFMIEIPLKITDQSNGQSASDLGKSSLGNFQGEHVLVVEDNEINLEIVRTLLEEHNLVVEAAQNGLEAVKKFENSAPYWYQLVLMDIRMPVMDGFTATKKIRSLKRPDSLSVPIVALSANALQEDIKYAEDVGMTAYLTKPIELEVLHRKLKEYMA